MIIADTPHMTNHDTTPRRVYIVTYRNYDTGDAVFRGVFFSEEEAQKYIKYRDAFDFSITTFEETYNGRTKEIIT